MPGRPAYQLYRLAWASLDLVFPPTCGGCEKRGNRWCEKCHSEVIEIKPPICEICGHPLKSPGLCESCRSVRPAYKAIRSWAIFGGPIRHAIHQLKYKRDISLGVYIARPLINLLSQLEWKCDLVIPVPLGVARLKERGYNQVELIARPLALGSGLAYQSAGLIRVRETHSQVGLSLEQRKANVKDAFVARSRWIAGRRVLVVDDVATSSATLSACATALYAAGAKEVYGITLARATHQSY